MRINEDKIIKKYQVGGSIIYQPIPLPGEGTPQSPQPAQSGGASEEDTGPLSKEIIKDLLGKGLTNDVMAFSESVNQAYDRYSNMSEMERGTVTGQRLRRLMKGDLSQLNMLVRNKEMLSGAIDRVKSNNAGSDYAVTERGVVVKNLETGAIAEISAEQYASNYAKKDGYKLLTNAELINEREYNQVLVNDQKSIQALNSAVSINGVKDEVRNVLANLGEVSHSNKSQKYVINGSSATPKELAAAISQMVGMGSDGFYKAGNSTSEASNSKNIQLASEAMWINLSANSKSLLKARAAANGVGAGNLEEAAKQYAISLLKPATKDSSSTEQSIDYDSSMTSDYLKAQKGEDEEKLLDEVGYYQTLFGQAGDQQKIEINAGTDSDLVGFGFKVRGLMEDGKPVSPNSMIRDTPSLQAVGDRESYSIGGMKIRRDQLDAIMYEGGEVASVEMPSVMIGNTVMPDRDLAPKYNAAMKEIDGLGDKLKNQAFARAQIFSKHGIPTGSNGQPLINLSNFITFSGKINNFAVDEGVTPLNKKYLEKVGSKEEAAYKKKFTLDSQGNEIAGADYGRFYNDTDVYRGQVFIHYTQGSIGDRLLDRKGLNTPKSINTPQHLGSPNTNRQNLNKGTPSYEYTPQ